MTDEFKTLKTFDAGKGREGLLFSLPALEEQEIGKISRLPVSIRIVLESVLRNCDGKKVRRKDVEALAKWNAKSPANEEIPFVVARIVLQDFTGVPLIVDLAAMRSAVQRLGSDPKIIEPLVPVDLVVDHSVQVDFFGSPRAFELNLDMEFKRNRERYQFLKWGQQAFKTFQLIPPGIGIVHQVNLEYLAKGVLSQTSEAEVRSRIFFPDTFVGTDSHTTMINGLGVVGWGVGGIEAEAGMLGQPVYFLTPELLGQRRREQWESPNCECAVDAIAGGFAPEIARHPRHPLSAWLDDHEVRVPGFQHRGRGREGDGGLSRHESALSRSGRGAVPLRVRGTGIPGRRSGDATGGSALTVSGMWPAQTSRSASGVSPSSGAPSRTFADASSSGSDSTLVAFSSLRVGGARLRSGRAAASR